MKSQIEIYQGNDGQTQIEVRFEGDTFWLPLQQISELFQRDKSVISRHIKNIYKEGELAREATVAKNATVQTEGKRTVEREVDPFDFLQHPITHNHPWGCMGPKSGTGKQC